MERYISLFPNLLHTGYFHYRHSGQQKTGDPTGRVWTDRRPFSTNLEEEVAEYHCHPLSRLMGYLVPIWYEQMNELGDQAPLPGPKRRPPSRTVEGGKERCNAALTDDKSWPGRMSPNALFASMLDTDCQAQGMLVGNITVGPAEGGNEHTRCIFLRL